MDNASFGFCGLSNLGNTCYMKQFFLIYYIIIIVLGFNV